MNSSKQERKVWEEVLYNQHQMIIGGALALFFLLYFWQTRRELPFPKERERMWRNSQKALEEHKRKRASSVYVKALPRLIAKRHRASLHVVVSSCEERGLRSTMEDRLFCLHCEGGALAGVLDGHGGREVAEQAALLLQERFWDHLGKMRGNLFRVFPSLIHEVHEEIAKNKEWDHQGCTAVLCFLDRQNHLVYTATLGDSEAMIYRRGKLIPLSCVRNWASRKDAKRASIALGDPSIAKEWPRARDPKELRYYNHLFCGLNVSRAIGDVSFGGTREKPAVVHTPKVTVHPLRKKDILFLACDGLMDYVSEEELVKELKRPQENLAQHLVRYALQEGGSRDNISVLTLRIL